MQPFPSGNVRFGAFADEIHLNKRAGHFLVLLLDYFGSVNLADSANTYNLVPDKVRAGDVLLERWQRVGIGHTISDMHLSSRDRLATVIAKPDTNLRGLHIGRQF